jgi:hypothetical protein
MTSKWETEILTGSFNHPDQFHLPDGGLDMKQVLLKFQAFMAEEYSQRDTAFLERHGRLIFLAFLKPIINGKGFDFKEAQISEERRLDVIVTYSGQKYVIELKRWSGPQAHQRGLAQLRDYLNRQQLERGFLIMFDFRRLRKGGKKQTIKKDGKEIFAVWV